MSLFQVRVGVDRSGERFRSGPIASFERLEEAERWAIELLRRTPAESGTHRYVAITTAPATPTPSSRLPHARPPAHRKQAHPDGIVSVEWVPAERGART